MFLFFIFLFILKCRYPRSKPISQTIAERHGPQILQLFRQFEKISKKHTKALLDLQFLTACKAFTVTPKFLRFKLYKQSLHRTPMYKTWQSELLSLEIDNTHKRTKTLQQSVAELKSSLKASLPLLDFISLTHFVYNRNKIYHSKISTIHQRKLKNLGTSGKLSPLPADKIIFNHSNRTLSARELFLLSFGLEFSLPIFKPDFFKHFIPFETLARRLEHQPPYKTSFTDICSQIKIFAQNIYSRKHKLFSPIISKDDIRILKNLSKDPALVISRPDKGRGVVILNRTDYNNKIESILSDQAKFRLLGDDSNSYTQSIKLQDKINRYLLKIKKLYPLINTQTYTALVMAQVHYMGYPRLTKLIFHYDPY